MVDIHYMLTQPHYIMYVSHYIMGYCLYIMLNIHYFMRSFHYVMTYNFMQFYALKFLHMLHQVDSMVR